MQTGTNEDVILDLFAAIEKRDVERILGIYHPEVEFHWPASLPYGGGSTGLAEPGAPTWGTRGGLSSRHQRNGPWTAASLPAAETRWSPCTTNAGGTAAATSSTTR